MTRQSFQARDVGDAQLTSTNQNAGNVEIFTAQKGTVGHDRPAATSEHARIAKRVLDRIELFH